MIISKPSPVILTATALFTIHIFGSMARGEQIYDLPIHTIVQVITLLSLESYIMVIIGKMITGTHQHLTVMADVLPR